jgi:protein-S-isoprenylcysteine O-methyltransferase Ste14
VFAWTGAALFAVSLAYFLFTYAVTFGVTTEGPWLRDAVAADIALFAAFALHHSLFARQRVRAWVARHASPGVERAIYVWVASLMLIAVCALWRPVPGVAWDLRGIAAWSLRGLQIFGIWLSLRGTAVIDVWELSGVRQARSTPNPQPPTPNDDGAASRAWELGVGNWEFRTDGPYGWVRHPIYLGWLLLVFATPRMTMTRLLFAAISSAYILIAIPFEERSLLRSSSGAYQRYREQVRWKVLPGLY